jgi:hypothetical protein
LKVVAPQAPLHINRLEYGGHPFSQTGLDHFGPYKIVGGKVWGLLCICLTTRAIHLEASKSMDTPHFLLSLERFVGRRGHPKRIQSDQGTQIVAGGGEVGKLYVLEEVQRVCARKWKTDFGVNPAGSPHWGGSWERMVGEVKKCLNSSFESMSGRLSYEAFQTCLVSIESILNKRPIAFDDDGVCLCPAQLLNPLSADSTPLPLNLSHFAMVRLVGEIVTKFWERWEVFFMGALNVERAMKSGRQIRLRVGDYVLVDDRGSNVFAKEWTVGEIVAVHLSPDGEVRKVTVKTGKGTFVRGLNRISLTEESILQRPDGAVFNCVFWRPIGKTGWMRHPLLGGVSEPGMTSIRTCVDPVA